MEYSAIGSHLEHPRGCSRRPQSADGSGARVHRAAFASLIFFNYVVQTTFLAVLAALANIRA